MCWILSILWCLAWLRTVIAAIHFCLESLTPADLFVELFFFFFSFC